MNRVPHNPHTTLSIRISTNGFCFCSYTASSPDTLLYHYHEAESNMPLAANFDAAWRACPFATNSYNEVKAIIVTEQFTVIPGEYDEKEHHSTLYRSCFPGTPADSHIIANTLTAQDSTVLFAVENALYNRLLQLGEATIYTPASILLGFLSRHKLSDGNYILAYYHKGKSLILSMRGDALQLSNSITSQETHDQAFYLLSIWQEQQLSQHDDTLFLCGDKSVEEITPLLRQFIRNTRRLNPNELFRSNLLNKINEIPFDLQALLLCE